MDDLVMGIPENEYEDVPNTQSIAILSELLSEHKSMVVNDTSQCRYTTWRI